MEHKIYRVIILSILTTLIYKLFLYFDFLYPINITQLISIQILKRDKVEKYCSILLSTSNTCYYNTFPFYKDLHLNELYIGMFITRIEKIVL